MTVDNCRELCNNRKGCTSFDFKEWNGACWTNTQNPPGLSYGSGN